MSKYHSLLKRQLKRHLGDDPAAPPAWQAFVESVNEAYQQFDADRRMLERSLDLSSQELLEANRELRAILQRLPDVFFRVDAAGVILDGQVHASSRAFRPAGELLGTRVQDLAAAEYRPAFDRAVAEVLEKNARAVLEFGLPNSAPLFFEAILLPLAEEQIIVFIRDVSLRRRAEEALRASERKHRELADTLPETIFETDAAGNILYLNASGLRDFGYSAADLAQGLSVEAFVAADFRDRVSAEIENAIRGEKYLQEWVALRKDGTPFPVTVYAIPVHQEGRPVGLRGIAINMSEKHRAEMEKARLHTAIEQAAESIMVADSAGSILYVNPAFERITGYSREETLGRNPRILKSGRQDHGYYRHMWELLASGHVWSGRLVDRRKDGTLFEWDSTISPVRDASGRIVNYVAVSRDITREVQLEEQLRQSQKMEAIGRLAGGVAHDFNNLLTVIMGNVDLVLPELAEGSPHREAVSGIREAAQRAAALTGQLLAFGRRQVLHPKVIDLNQVVERMQLMFGRLLSENIDLQIRLDPALGRVRADPSQMEQVLMNLVINARDAMPDGGALTILTCNAEIDDDHALRLGDVGPGVYVVLEISDTGVGMDAETRQHLFEPFFTTKERGRGTGLGLATVYGIVKQSGGHISVYSEPGQGSTFRVYLPLLPAGVVVAEEPRPASGLVAGTETVLVVEDEDLVRKLTSAMLQKQGYSVVAARNGDEAVRLVTTHTGPLDLVLSDVVMPGMKVETMAERIQAMVPGIRILYMSGHPESTIIHLGAFSEGLPLLKKPFTAAELGRKVREILDG